MSATCRRWRGSNERYRAPTIIVAIVEGDKDSGPLTVGGLRYDTQTGARSEIPAVDGAGRGPARRRGQADPRQARRAVARRRHGAPRFAGHDRRLRADPARSATGCRCASGWAACRRSRRVAVRKLEADRAELRLEYSARPSELQRTLAPAGLQLDKEADKWRLQAR